jgi:hypothetical protein
MLLKNNIINKIIILIILIIFVKYFYIYKNTELFNNPRNNRIQENIKINKMLDNKGLGLVDCKKYSYLCIKNQNKKNKLKYRFEPYTYATKKGILNIKTLKP